LKPVGSYQIGIGIANGGARRSLGRNNNQTSGRRRRDY
jgi:hypothetical protein